jgi:DNA-binding transcriptional ArsR family regulator
VRDLQKIMGALSSPVRREILSLVWDREMPAGRIAEAFSVTKPTISQHLAVLREAGLVTSTAVGTSRKYRARPAGLRGLYGALSDSGRWTNADDVPERALAVARTRGAVSVSVEVDAAPGDTFRALVDPVVYSRWLGVPVRIEEDRFSCTLEWGTQVRGRYEVVSAPELIAMRWDFDDNAVPVPGAELSAYLRVAPGPAGSHVEVHQLVDTVAQAEFMEAAWSLVLGRLKLGLVDALDPDVDMPPHGPREKRRAGSAQVTASAGSSAAAGVSLGRPSTNTALARAARRSMPAPRANAIE